MDDKFERLFEISFELGIFVENMKKKYNLTEAEVINHLKIIIGTLN